MNVQDIINRVRNTAGDTNVLQFTDSMLVDWINDAIQEIVVENSLLQISASQSLVVGTVDYNLPSDIFKLYSVIVDNSKIQVLTLQEWEELTLTGVDPNSNARVSHCYVWAGKLSLYPPPDSTYTMKINYTRMPTLVAIDPDNPEEFLGVIPEIPTSYHPRIVTYCLAQVALQDEDIVKYQNLMQEFTTGVVSLKHQTESEEDLYPFISVSLADDQGYLSW